MDGSFSLLLFLQFQLLGSGAIENQVLANAGRPVRVLLKKYDIEQNECGWALGMGLERLAMQLFQIPDIRLFWLTDKRFTSQFECNLV